MKCWLAEARMEVILLSVSSCSDSSGPCHWQPVIHEWKIISSVTEVMSYVLCPPGRFEVTRPLPSGLVLNRVELLGP